MGNQLLNITYLKRSQLCHVADATTWDGKICEYSRYWLSFYPETSIKTQLIHLDAGKSVSWVVQFQPPTKKPRLAFRLKSKGGNLKGLSIAAYQLGHNLDPDYNDVFDAKDLCWSTVGSGI
jgi:hypothetical protein